MLVPESLRWLGLHEDGVQWLNQLPCLVDELKERWDLELRGEAFSSGNLACVASSEGLSAGLR